MEIFVVFGLVSALNMGATYGASEIYADLVSAEDYTPVVEVTEVTEDTTVCKRRALFDSQCKVN